MTDREKEIWDDEFAIIGGDLVKWNLNVIPWMEQRGTGYKRYAHAYAKTKGWVYDKTTHSYQPEKPLTTEEYLRVMQRLADKEIRKWLKKDTRKIAQSGRGINRPLRIVPTKVRNVLVYWERTSGNDNGIMVVWDCRTEKMIQHVWKNVPEELYRRLFDEDGRKVLNDVFTIYRGQEISPFECVDLLQNLEQGLVGAG